MKALTLGSTKDETWPFLSFFPEGHLSRARGTIHLGKHCLSFLPLPCPTLLRQHRIKASPYLQQAHSQALGLSFPKGT